MKTVTTEDIKRVEDHSMNYDLHWINPRWNYYDVLAFLEKKGYDVIVHRAETDLQLMHSVPGTGEVERGDIIKDCMKEKILAIKPGTVLPTRLDSKEAVEMRVLNVFTKELKQALLNL